ncbi:ionic transporter y4hA [Catenulispora subtropica]|uniref:Sodium/calcium exchanger membrane region domain-containing protein n=1 Tax=Catenulispora subtropica TaxID=450798 RepID=A0ABN2T4F7_9ACTN
MSTDSGRVPPWASWSTVVPVLAAVLLAFTWGRDLPGWAVSGVALFLAGSVLAAVHHAEVVAHRVGEPFGSLVLAVAVTLIEVALIVTMMSSNGAKSATLARDTVFAAIMITCNGIAGLCLLLVALKRGLARFNADGTATVFGAIITLAGLTLVLPTFTTSPPGPEFNTTQLANATVDSIVLYGLYIVAVTVRHRPDYLPVDAGSQVADPDDADYESADSRSESESGPGSGSGSESGSESGSGPRSSSGSVSGSGSGSGYDEHGYEGDRPTAGQALTSLGLLVLALIAVVGLGKGVSPTIERGVDRAGLPSSVVGVVIALLVLLPESIAAVRAARRDELQTSLNLALGSAMASIGLTVPAIAVATIWLTTPLILGLDGSHMVLLALTVAAGSLTFVRGRATLVQGGVHLAVCFSYLVLAVSP